MSKKLRPFIRAVVTQYMDLFGILMMTTERDNKINLELRSAAKALYTPTGVGFPMIACSYEKITPRH